MNSEFQPPKTYRTIAVIGSGVMGTGIALAGASADCEVMIWDLSDAILADAMSRIDGTLQVDLRKGRISAERKSEILARITPVRDIEDVGAVQCVIEAAPERMDIKRDVFARLSAACAPDCVLATNTSSLSVTAIAAAASHPERVIGMHFFNPAHAMRLVEVVPGRSTSDSVVDSIMRFAAALGKTPVRVKDSPGFIVNRVARPFYNEALRILEEGIADAEAIDRILTAQGFRMGPFALMDLIGNDVNYAVTQSLYDAYHQDPRYRPSRLQRAMIEAGRLGRKTGEGFYKYPDTDPPTRGGEGPR